MLPTIDAPHAGRTRQLARLVTLMDFALLRDAGLALI